MLIELFYLDPLLFKEIKSVFIDINEKSLEYTIESKASITGNKAIIKLEKINSIDEAKEFVKKPIYFSADDSIKSDLLFPQKLVGFELMDEKKGFLGKVEYIYPLNNQFILSFTQNGKEILIPLNEQIILNIDHKSEQIILRIPDGLLEVYL